MRMARRCGRLGSVADIVAFVPKVIPPDFHLKELHTAGSTDVPNGHTFRDELFDAARHTYHYSNSTGVIKQLQSVRIPFPAPNAGEVVIRPTWFKFPVYRSMYHVGTGEYMSNWS